MFTFYGLCERRWIPQNGLVDTVADFEFQRAMDCSLLVSWSKKKNKKKISPVANLVVPTSKQKPTFPLILGWRFCNRFPAESGRAADSFDTLGVRLGTFWLLCENRMGRVQFLTPKTMARSEFGGISFAGSSRFRVEYSPKLFTVRSRG